MLSPKKLRVEVNEFLSIPMCLILLRPWSSSISHWVHSGQFTDRLPLWRKTLYNVFLRRVEHCVFVSPHIIKMFERNRVHVPDNFTIKYAFIPPDVTDKPRVLRSYGPKALTFMVSRDPLLVMQGADAFHDGVDRYGTDLAIEMLANLVHQFPNAGLFVGRPSGGDARAVRYFNRLEEQIRAWGLTEHVLFLTGEKELWPAIEHATLFLRPSNQDGDSISVREAMSLGTSVVASDACPRPAGVGLFVSRDATDFERAVSEALNHAQKPGRAKPEEVLP